MFKRLIILLLLVATSALSIGYATKDSVFDNAVRYKLGYRESELNDYYNRMLLAHSRIDAQVVDGATIIIGDSITQGLLYPRFVNFGISGDTTYGVLNRLDKYQSIGRAKKVILLIGVNDLERRSNDEIIANYRQILAKVPHDKLIVFSILPVTHERELKQPNMLNSRIVNINKSLAQLCNDNSVRFIDMRADFIDNQGYLKQQYTSDGLHLNTNGYKAWRTYLDKI